MSYEDDDCMASDDVNEGHFSITRLAHSQPAQFESFLEMSRLEDQPSPSSRPGPSNYQAGPMYARKQELNREIAGVDAELGNIQSEISRLKEYLTQRSQDREKLLQELEELSASSRSKGKSKATGGIDYTADDFEWSGELKNQLKKVFKIDNFRLCQQG